MREKFDEALARIDELKSSEAAQKFSNADRIGGRIVGAGRAIAWCVCGVFAYLTGELILGYAKGWTAEATIFLTAAIIIYMVWRAYRALFFPPRLSELVADEVINRVKPAQKALGLAMSLRRRFPGGKSQI
ncbi:MAG: hypothetical protein R3C58_14820 [Parvularculaceae bacterium]